MSREDRRRRRVAESHQVAGAAFRLAGGFASVAAVWALWTLLGGGSWWGPLHAFLAGTVLLAISGATQLFTVTWAAAPAPPAVTAAVQRLTLAGGAGVVLAGMATGVGWVVAVGAVAVTVGLVTLAGALMAAVRSSLLRRFDLSARFYLLAVAAGVVGVTLGGLMAAGFAGEWYGRMRLVHSHLNLVGLVGLTITGTIPTFLPTLAHHRAVSGSEARLGWWLSAAAAASIGAGLAVGEWAVGVGTMMAGLALAVILAGILVRLGKRGLRAGLGYLQVAAGCGWLAAWAVVDGLRLLAGSPSAPFAPWTAAVVTAGIGQVLLGALAYLLPVLAGPAPRLGRNLERTHRHAWIPLLLANLAGLAFAVASLGVAATATGLWAVDFVRRLAVIEWRDPTTR